MQVRVQDETEQALERPTTSGRGDEPRGRSRASDLTTPAPSARVRRRRRRRAVKFGALAALVVLATLVGVSLGGYLTRPSNEALDVRFVEWVRDHGGDGIVNRIENWWYTQHPPRKGGTPKGGIPAVASATRHAPVTLPVTPPVRPGDIPVIARTALPGEGVWQPVGRVLRGSPAVYETFLRPDPVHTSLLTGVAWMNHELVRGALYNGLELPGGGPWRNGTFVAPADTPSLVAAFNSGFKLRSSRGGYFTEGRTVQPVVDGRATLVIRSDGSVSVGMLGRDFAMDPTIVSARQNLDLLVDGGQPAAGLNGNDTSKWGSTLGNKVYVWRSGVGVDAAGNLIYVGGNGLNITTLAGVLRDAGCVRAMELDINSYWVSYYTYEGATPADTHGTKLLQSMERPPNRFLRPGTRDFVALFVR